MHGLEYLQEVKNKEVQTEGLISGRTALLNGWEGEMGPVPGFDSPDLGRPKWRARRRGRESYLLRELPLRY
jgi:hypothetical protein